MGTRMRLCVGWGLDLTDRDKTRIGYEHLEDEDLFKAFKTDVETGKHEKIL